MAFAFAKWSLATANELRDMLFDQTRTASLDTNVNIYCNAIAFPFNVYPPPRQRSDAAGGTGVTLLRTVVMRGTGFFMTHFVAHTTAVASTQGMPPGPTAPFLPSAHAHADHRVKLPCPWIFTQFNVHTS